MRDIQIERALFLDPKLKGQAARAAAMSKQLTDNEQADDQNVMNMKRVLDLRAQVKAKVKEVEIYEKIAKQHNRGVERVEQQKLQAIEQKSPSQTSTRKQKQYGKKAESKPDSTLSGVDIEELTKNSTRLMEVLKETSRELFLQ